MGGIGCTLHHTPGPKFVPRGYEGLYWFGVDTAFDTQIFSPYCRLYVCCHFTTDTVQVMLEKSAIADTSSSYLSRLPYSTLSLGFVVSTILLIISRDQAIQCATRRMLVPNDVMVRVVVTSA